jgi:hypothetical protein
LPLLTVTLSHSYYRRHPRCRHYSGWVIGGQARSGAKVAFGATPVEQRSGAIGHLAPPTTWSKARLAQLSCSGRWHPRTRRAPLAPGECRVAGWPRSRESSSHQTHCWRGLDSNFPYRAEIGLGFRLPDDHRCATARCPGADAGSPSGAPPFPSGLGVLAEGEVGRLVVPSSVRAPIKFTVTTRLRR